MKFILFLVLIPLLAMGAEIKISELPLHAQSGWASGDVLPIVDVTLNKTKKTRIQDFDARYFQLDDILALSQTSGNLPVTRLDPLTASRAVVTNISGVLAVSDTTSTQIDYLKNLNSDVQDQIDAITSGTVTDVTASSPLFSSGGATPNLTIQQATNLLNGYLSFTDWNTFNGKEGPISAGTNLQYWRGDKTFQTLNTTVVPEGSNLYFTDARSRAAISVDSPLTYNFLLGVISMPVSNNSQDGYLSAVDHTTFNAKEPPISSGTTAQYWRGDKTFQTLDTLAVPENTNLYFTTTRARQSISSTAPVSYSNVSGVISMAAATNSVDGYLLATDWVTFNAKQAAGNYLTALTNDVSASGPGSASATVNSVGGKTSTEIATSVNLTQAATTASNPNTLALRDASGAILPDTISLPNTGDIPYRNAGGKIQALHATTNGFVLTLSGGLPIWSAPSSSSRDVYYSDFTGASCAKSLGTTSDVAWNNLGGVTCTVTERVGLGVTGLTQVSGEFGLTGTLNAHTYEVCAAFHYEQQTSGVGSRITQSLRMAVCSGSSACATTGQTYYVQPYLDMISPAAGAGLHSIAYRACFITTIGSAGTYSINMQENTTNNSGTVGSNDFGCNGSENTCQWAIKQVD